MRLEQCAFFYNMGLPSPQWTVMGRTLYIIAMDVEQRMRRMMYQSKVIF
jgi:hypothetical protein